MTPVVCEQVRQSLPEYWAGLLAVKQHREIDAHLETCLSCRTEAAELGRIWNRLDDIPSAEPGPQVRSRFYQMLDAYRSGIEEGVKPPARAAGFWQRFAAASSWRMPALAAAGSFAMLAIGFVAGRGTTGAGPASADPAKENTQIAQLRSEVNSMRQMMAISLLQQQSATDRMRGVSFAYRVDKSDGEVVSALLETVRTDPSVNVRLSAVDAFRNFSSNTGARRKLLEAVRAQESPLVQIAIIELLVDLNDQTATKALEALTSDSGLPKEVRDRARWAVTQLH